MSIRDIAESINFEIQGNVIIRLWDGDEHTDMFFGDAEQFDRIDPMLLDSDINYIFPEMLGDDPAMVFEIC